ncbi:MAG TPA: hypothetical protein HPP95_12910 [Deltaproteobacteria bacterium]|nr:hypothetical protein [Deltaproteobacteria bacterium]
MKQTLSTNQAVGLLIEYKAAGWTREGAEIIVQHLEEIERDWREHGSGEEIEFDAVCISCDYHEYKSLEDLVGDYPELAEKKEKEILDWLQDEGMLIGQTSEGVVVRNQ